MSSDCLLPHIATSQATSGVRQQQTTDAHNTSADSGTCNPLRTSPESTSLSPVDHQAQLPSATSTAHDNDTLYSDSFETTSNNSAPVNESDPHNLISEDEAIVAETSDQPLEASNKPPALKRATSTKQPRSGCEIILRAESLKKIYLRQSSGDNVLFKNATRFNRSKSTNQVVNTSSCSKVKKAEKTRSTPTDEIDEVVVTVDNDDQKQLKHCSSTPVPQERVKTGLPRRGTAKTASRQEITAGLDEPGPESNQRSTIAKVIIKI